MPVRPDDNYPQDAAYGNSRDLEVNRRKESLVSVLSWTASRLAEGEG
jgi:hypothetical protein